MGTAASTASGAGVSSEGDDGMKNANVAPQQINSTEVRAATAASPIVIPSDERYALNLLNGKQSSSGAEPASRTIKASTRKRRMSLKQEFAIKNGEDDTAERRLMLGRGVRSIAVISLDDERRPMLADPETPRSATDSIAIRSSVVIPPSSFELELVRENYLGREVSVLVSDLSGFTRTTRKHGITHFASIIVRMRQLVLPWFHERGILYLTTEADNLIAVFPDAHSGVLAALGMQWLIRTYNEGIAERKANGREHFKITLNGVAVDVGKDVLVDTDGTLHGKTFLSAYELGEEVCDGGCVLLTQRALKVACRESEALNAALSTAGATSNPEEDSPQLERLGNCEGGEVEAWTPPLPYVRVDHFDFAQTPTLVASHFFCM